MKTRARPLCKVRLDYLNCTRDNGVGKVPSNATKNVDVAIVVLNGSLGHRNSHTLLIPLHQTFVVLADEVELVASRKDFVGEKIPNSVHCLFGKFLEDDERKKVDFLQQVGHVLGSEFSSLL